MCQHSSLSEATHEHRGDGCWARLYVLLARLCVLLARLYVLLARLCVLLACLCVSPTGMLVTVDMHVAHQDNIWWSL